MNEDENSFNEELKNENVDANIADTDIIKSDVIKPDDTHYSNSGFWHKVRTHYRRAGRKLLSIAITLFYTLRDSDTPQWAKNIIICALGYFILPLDILPDFIPITGFTDDLATILIALGAVALHIKDAHKEQAFRIVKTLFKI